MYNQCTYTLIIIKQFHNHIKKYLSLKYKKNSCLVNIRMINLWFDELILIAQIRNISNYENKSKEDLIKALSEIKPETITSEKLKPEIIVNKKKLKKLRKDFDELRHKFSKKEIDRYRKAFYVAKNKKYLPKSEIKQTNESFNKLKKVWHFKNFEVLIALIMKTSINMIIIMILLMMMNIQKSGVLENYLKNYIEIITNQ